ncbi:sugar transferase [Gymnodinialimonas sp. 2305UL16-5]|uniref:sugar transferase n=1 Tax=Gymnodinialimonas mytili TaxID=3126503 RepID=UPI00309B76EC
MDTPRGEIEVRQHAVIAGLEKPSGAITWPPAFAVGGVAKRCLDFSMALFALLVLSPLLLFVILAIKLTSPGPVFFGHERVGFGRNTFKCWKFRTMCVDADRVLSECLASNPELRAEWDATQKLKDDPRVTRLGRVLREYSVDELPQLFNVLLGDMSFVGPRPVVDAELVRFGDSAPLYLSARPGITGLWQISGRSDTSYSERVQLDAQYVTRWSLWQDVMIVLKTVPVVLGARGSY